MNVPNNANDLATAIKNVSAYWLDQLNSGLRNLINAQNRTPANDDEKKQKATDVATAQGQMLSAIQQLAHCETMESDRLGRTGYNSVVTLMTDTQAAAKDLYDKLRTLTTFATTTTTPDPATADQIGLMLKILDELSRLAPTTIWQQASSSTSA